jgi:Fe-S-cluster containining protein
VKKTPQLKALLEQYKSLLPEDQFASFEAEVNRLLIHYTDTLANFAPGDERGRRVHDLIEEQNAASSHIKTSCQKGCGACCHLEVEITRDDANILADSIANGMTLDTFRLRELSKRVRLDDAWKMGFNEANRCVFLGADNACRNYENRPTVCRKHSVISPVSECETVGGNPIPKLMPLAEIVMSAAVNQPGNDFGSLAKMLQLVLDERAGVVKNSILPNPGIQEDLI